MTRDPTKAAIQMLHELRAHGIEGTGGADRGPGVSGAGDVPAAEGVPVADLPARLRRLSLARHGPPLLDAAADLITALQAENAALVADNARLMGMLEGEP